MDKDLLGLLKDGTKIYEVNGKDVRDQINVKYIEGGHGYVYGWIPQDEIWVERMLDRADEESNLIHEVYEQQIMKDTGMPYDDAHEHALSVERVIRKLRSKKASLADCLRVYACQVRLSKNLLIDDQWEPETLGMTKKQLAKTSDDAMRMLSESQWDTVYLDNDLGPGQKEGCQILDWVLRDLPQEKWPRSFVIFTMNNQAALTMESKLRSTGYILSGKDHGHPIWTRP